MPRFKRAIILSTFIPLILTALIAGVSVFFTNQSKGYLSPLPNSVSVEKNNQQGEIKGRQIMAPIPFTPTPILTDSNPAATITPIITSITTATPTPTTAANATPTPTPISTPTPTPTPAILTCDADCLNTVATVLTSNNLNALYNQLSSGWQEDLSLADLEASATSSASITSTTVSNCQQTTTNWCSVNMNLTLTDGSSGTYTVILYRENNHWLIYGTE